MPERPKGAVCKIAGVAYGGSNPPPPTSGFTVRATEPRPRWSHFGHTLRGNAAEPTFARQGGAGGRRSVDPSGIVPADHELAPGHGVVVVGDQLAKDVLAHLLGRDHRGGTRDRQGAEASPSQRRVRAALEGTSEGDGRTVREISNRLAKDGHGRPLRDRTIQKALAALTAEGEVDGEDPGTGLAGRWWLRSQLVPQSGRVFQCSGPSPVSGGAPSPRPREADTKRNA